MRITLPNVSLIASRHKLPLSKITPTSIAMKNTKPFLKYTVYAAVIGVCLQAVVAQAQQTKVAVIVLDGSEVQPPVSNRVAPEERSAGEFTIPILNTAVFDQKTKLWWQRSDDDTDRTMRQARDYCDSLTLNTFSDWRLPSAEELLSIVSFDKFSPSVITAVFIGTDNAPYWTGTQNAAVSSEAWTVNFWTGAVLLAHRNDTHRVRCVRRGI